MKIIPIHYTPSLKVDNWLQIEHQAHEVASFIDSHEYGEFKSEMFALHHMQVSEKPFNFFVLNPTHLGAQVEELGSRFIVNPRVTAVETGSLMPLMEGCVSFPHRKNKNVDRYLIIHVEYDIPDSSVPSGLKHCVKQVERIVAQIFQHECDHAEGKNIHFKSLPSVL
jgi:peptide deformylase